MKTMSITKIALALLVSIPALSLNGAAVATTVPSLWRSVCSKTEQLTSRAVSGMKSGLRAGFVGTRNFVANHKTASKWAVGLTAATATGFATWKLIKRYQEAKDAQEAHKAMLARKFAQEAREAMQARKSKQEADDEAMLARKNAQEEVAKIATQKAAFKQRLHIRSHRRQQA